MLIVYQVSSVYVSFHAGEYFCAGESFYLSNGKENGNFGLQN